MGNPDRPIEDIKQDFEHLRQDIGSLAESDLEDMQQVLSSVLLRLVDMVETVSLQQIAGYQESAKAFQAIGDALRGILTMVGEKSPGDDSGNIQ